MHVVKTGAYLFTTRTNQKNPQRSPEFYFYDFFLEIVKQRRKSAENSVIYLFLNYNFATKALWNKTTLTSICYFLRITRKKEGQEELMHLIINMCSSIE